MQRRFALCFAFALAAGCALPAAAQVAQPGRAGAELALYGVPIRAAQVDAFVAAARAAGGQPLSTAAGAAVTLDTRRAGVPALEQLSVVGFEGQVASVIFQVKGYGEDNVELRGLLLAKYGVPMAMGARPLPYPAFADRALPRGAFEWHFDDGMTLVYEHPRVGPVTLSYLNPQQLAALEEQGRRRPAPALRDRF